MKKPRVVMLGTGDFALPTFLALCGPGARVDVLALVTQPSRPRGRKQEIIPSPILVAARDRGIPVFQPLSINDPDSIEHLRQFESDLLITAAYGQILSAEVLGTTRLGGINLHGSLLPAYRGAAPVARAIQHGETETGVTVIQMNPKVDAGGMLLTASTTIGAEETAGELEERLSLLGAPLVVQAIHGLMDGSLAAQPQDHSRVSKAPKLTSEDGWIDWSLPARGIHNLVRAMQPRHAAWTDRPAGKADQPAGRLIVHRSRISDQPLSPTGAKPGTVLDAGMSRLVVATGEGALELITVQVPGKKPMTAAEFLRGHPLFAGQLLGSKD